MKNSQRSDITEQLTVSDKQWKKVNEYFENNPNEIKLYRTSHYRKVDDYSIKFSVIKIGDDLYALGNKSIPKIGKGAFGRVKYAVNPKGELIALKIQKANSRDIFESCKKEEAIYDDLEILRGSAKRIRIGKSPKYYLALEYLGKSIPEYFKEKDAKGQLTDKLRLNIAIQCAILVYKLHSGELSKTNTSYLHRDIKEMNFTVDENDRVHLIDFGLSTKVDKEMLASKGDIAGTPNFICSDVIKHQFSNHTDLFALFRTFYLPQKFEKYSIGLAHRVMEIERNRINDFHKKYNMVLNDRIINAKKLSFISKESVNDTPTDPAEVVAAYLIARYLKLGLKYATLQNNHEISKKIIDAYENQLDKKVLKAILRLKQSPKKELMIDYSMSDPKFFTMIDDLNKRLDEILKPLKKDKHKDDAKHDHTRYKDAKRIFNYHKSAILNAVTNFIESKEAVNSDQSIRNSNKLLRGNQTKFEKSLTKANRDFQKQVIGPSNQFFKFKNSNNANQLLKKDDVDKIIQTTDDIFNLACARYS